MTAERRRSFWDTIWRQAPFFLWLILIWMLLWGQFTVLSAVSGLAVALFVTRVFRLPPVELSGRINVWYLIVLMVTFLGEVVWGSLHVAWYVLNPRRYPDTGIIRVQLETDDDLIMTHVAVTASLIPGSLVVQTDRDNRALYLHIIGNFDRNSPADQRAWVRKWERRIVRALGSRAQYAALRTSEGHE